MPRNAGGRRDKPQPRRVRPKEPKHQQPATSVTWEELLAQLQIEVTREKWGLICGRAVVQAVLGDAEARRWLSDLLARCVSAGDALADHRAPQRRDKNC